LPEDSPDDPIEHERHERRLFFVAATRAMRRLIVTASDGGDHSPFIAVLTDKAWDIQ
jgi:superfamily I DNA/RNA helicase